MINIERAYAYCREDIENIENYELAIKDTKETWLLHHKLGTIIRREDLKRLKLYYNRPAIELVFLTNREHRKLHSKFYSPFKGKHHTEESKRKLREAHIGKPSWNKGIKTNKPAYNRVVIDKETEELIINLYTSGKSFKDINIETKISRHLIKRILKENNIVIRKFGDSGFKKGHIPWNKLIKK